MTIAKWISIAVLLAGAVASTATAQSGLDRFDIDLEYNSLRPLTPYRWELKTGDPVLPVNGEVRVQKPDLSVPSRGMPFAFERCYRSFVEYNGPLGRRWSFNFNSWVRVDTAASPMTADFHDGGENRIDVFTQDGSSTTFKAGGGNYNLMTVSGGLAEIRTPGGSKLKFAKITGTSGTLDYYRLTSMDDRNGNSMSCSYDAAGIGGKLTSVTDTVGRSYTFTYDSNARIIKLQDFGTTPRTIGYGYDTNGDLVSVTELEGESGLARTTTYTYDSNHRVVTITDPKENAKTTPSPFVRNYYDGTGRVVGQEYGPGAATDDGSTPSGPRYTWSYDMSSSPRCTTFVNREGDETRYYFDSNGLCVKKVYENGANDVEENFYYDSYSNLTKTVKGEGNEERFSYDTGSSYFQSQGNLVSHKTCASGGSSALETTYTYETTFNQVATVTHPSGRVDTFSYDSNGNLTGQVIDSGSSPHLNLTTTYGYDSAHGNQISYSQDGLNHRTAYDYDSRGYLTKTRGDSTGLNQTLGELAYDEFGNLTKTTDARGKFTTMTVNRLNQVTQVTSPLGYDTKFYYDASDNLTKTEVENGGSVDGSGDFVTLLAYDLLDNLTSRTEDKNASITEVTTYAYDAEDRLTLVTDPESSKVCYTFNDLGMNDSATFGYTASGASTYHYEFDKNFRLTKTIEPKSSSHATTFAYDHHDRLTKTTNALGHFSKTVFASTGLVDYAASYASSDTTNPMSKSSLQYDTADRVTKTLVMMKVSPTGSIIGDGSMESVTEYDAASRVTKTKDDGGHETTMAYDTLNRLTMVTDPIGSYVQTAYDVTNNKVTRTEYEKESPTSTTFDTFAYTLEYDDENRLTRSVDPGGKATLFTYDARSLTRVEDPNGSKVYTKYNEQLEKVEVRVDYSATAQLTTKWEYDKAGRMTKVIDPKNQATTFAYDHQNRQTTQTFADSYAITYTYDLNSNISTRTDQNATAVTYAYDLANRLTQKSLSISAAHIKGESTGATFAYDALNRLTLATDTDSRVLYTYNTAGLVESEQEQYGAWHVTCETGKTVEWDYNAQGLVSAVRYPGATESVDQLDYLYDTNNRLTEVKREASPAAVRVAKWTYMGSSRVIKRENGNDTYAAYTYDSRKNLIKIEHKHIESPSHRKLMEFNQVVDDASHVIGEGMKFYKNDGTLSEDKGLDYFYDKAYRLTKCYRDVPTVNIDGTTPDTYGTKVEYVLDASGNRTAATYTPLGESPETETYTANSTNAYTNVVWRDSSDTDYEYDKAGNRTWQTDTDRSWGYDYQNKLVEVRNGGDWYCQYDYDVLGRRMAKRYIWNGISGEWEHQERFYYAGRTLIQEYKITGSGETEAETLTFDYVWGLSNAEPVQIREIADPETEDPNVVAFYHQSAFGSVYMITQDNGTADILENYRFEEFGVPTVYSGDGATAATTVWGNKMLWHGDYYDFEVVNVVSGLSLYGDKPRGYDPEIASYLSRSADDPSAGNAHAPDPHTSHDENGPSGSNVGKTPELWGFADQNRGVPPPVPGDHCPPTGATLNGGDGGGGGGTTGGGANLGESPSELPSSLAGPAVFGRNCMVVVPGLPWMCGLTGGGSIVRNPTIVQGGDSEFPFLSVSAADAVRAERRAKEEKERADQAILDALLAKFRAEGLGSNSAIAVHVDQLPDWPVFEVGGTYGFWTHLGWTVVSVAGTIAGGVLGGPAGAAGASIVIHVIAYNLGIENGQQAVVGCAFDIFLCGMAGTAENIVRTVESAGEQGAGKAGAVAGENATSKVITPVSNGAGRAAKQGTPNSIYEQIDGAGNVRSRTFYDENGRSFCRQDFDHAHGGMQPHEHLRDFDSQGRPISNKTTRPVPSGYDNKPSN